MTGSAGRWGADQFAHFFGNMTSLKYGKEREKESDNFSIQVMM
jgi:hypothetical protein